MNISIKKEANIIVDEVFGYMTATEARLSCLPENFKKNLSILFTNTISEDQLKTYNN